MHRLANFKKFSRDIRPNPVAGGTNAFPYPPNTAFGRVPGANDRYHGLRSKFDPLAFG